ncbi:calpain-15 [Pelomyxa schiedti]|nr:calpain-15 [Pelomyxa schiedti]
MSATVGEWNAAQVVAWACEVLSMKHDGDPGGFLKGKLGDGNTLLALGRRELSLLDLPLPQIRKLEYALHKLKEAEEKKKDDAELRERETLIAEKMLRIEQTTGRPDTAAAVAPAKNPNITESRQSDETPTPSVSGAQPPNLWSRETVSAWLRSVGQEAYIASFLQNGVDGAKLVTLTPRDIRDTIAISDIKSQRELDYQISRLRQALEYKSDLNKKSDSGVICGGPSIVTIDEAKYLTENIYFFKTTTENSVTFQLANNNTASILPISYTLNVNHIENLAPQSSSNFASPVDTLPILLQGYLAKSKTENILHLTAIDSGKPWKLEYEIQWKAIESAWDFSRIWDAQFVHKLSVFSKLSPPTTPSSTEDIQELIAWCSSRGLTFLDSQFPPSEKSLYIDPNDKPKQQIPIHWKTPVEFFDRKVSPKLFPGDIDSRSIAQGLLGDCWFLGALCMISTRPELVLRLFLNTEYNPQGVYGLRFLRGDEWVTVTVDGYLPCAAITGISQLDYETQLQTSLAGHGPVYSRSRDESLWVCYLEKGYAKLNKSYQALTAGTLGESLRDLTGAPCITYNFKLLSRLQQENLWFKLLEAKAANQLFGCSSRKETQAEKDAGLRLENEGIVSLHAYGILDVRNVAGNKLLLLRNPWGSFTWCGRWSAGSSQWTPDLKRIVGYSEHVGAFWMCWEDFQQFFGEITICMVGATEGWQQTKILGKYSHPDSVYGPQIQLEVTEATHTFITIQKRDLRFSCGADVDNRQGIYLVIYDESTGILETVCGTTDTPRREVTMEVDLEVLPPGKHYIIIISACISNVKFQSVDYTLSITSKSTIKVTKLETDVKRLLRTVMGFIKNNIESEVLVGSSLTMLTHLAFFRENRILFHEVDCLSLILQMLNKYKAEKGFVKSAVSLLWSLSCDLGVREALNNLNASEVINRASTQHYANVEVRETCDVALRNLQLATAIAMDPLIEKCILSNACTFSATGDKTFLLQPWYDCYTCNLRTGYGVCAVCAETCHHNHHLSLPKFSHFFCDCGHGRLNGLKRCPAVKDLAGLGLTKRREHDEGVEEEEDPAPIPLPFPITLPGPETKKTTKTTPVTQTRIHTLFG